MSFPRIAPHRELVLVLSFAVLTRLTLFTTTSMPLAIERRPELTTALTSFRSRKYLLINLVNLTDELMFVLGK